MAKLVVGGISTERERAQLVVVRFATATVRLEFAVGRLVPVSVGAWGNLSTETMLAARKYAVAKVARVRLPQTARRDQ